MTYQLTQYVDFVKEHFLLVLVHVALSQYLNCSLGTCFSVHTHPHFSESTYRVLLDACNLTAAEHLADSVVISKLASVLGDELSCSNPDVLAYTK